MSQLCGIFIYILRNMIVLIELIFVRKFGYGKELISKIINKKKKEN